MDLTVCPECAAVAEIRSRDVLESTDGPVEHAKIRCARRHWFRLPVASLAHPSSGELATREPAAVHIPDVEAARHPAWRRPASAGLTPNPGSAGPGSDHATGGITPGPAPHP